MDPIIGAASEDSKPCPVCAEKIKSAAVKCRFCNTDLLTYTETRQFEVETSLFSGHPAIVYTVGQLAPFLFLTAGAVIGVVADYQATGGIHIAPIFLACVLAFALATVIFWVRLYVKHLARHFQITTQRIKLERGLFSKVQESLELFRVDHFELRKPLGQRLLGYAS